MPISVIPSRNLGQRFLVGSKNTGRTSSLKALFGDWSTGIGSDIQQLYEIGKKVESLQLEYLTVTKISHQIAYLHGRSHADIAD